MTNKLLVSAGMMEESHSQSHHHITKSKHENNDGDTNPNGIDLISSLPDEILHHVLSFMSTQDVLKTSVLSKRWRPLWACVPKLSFHSYELCQELRDSIEKTLSLYVSPKIKTFALDLDFDEDDVPYIDTWIKFAMEHKVEVLDLHLYEMNQPRQYLFDNSTLLELRLSFPGCDFEPRGPISGTSLKSLELECLQLSNESVTSILSGCPVLESLTIDNGKGIDRIDLRSHRLKRLVIVGDARDFRIGEIEIEAPNLQSSSLKGDIKNIRYRLIDVSSLVEADISLCIRNYDSTDKLKIDEYQEMLLEILGKLEDVEKLTLGTWALQVLTVSEIKGLSYPLLKCESLILNMHFCKWTAPGISRVLQCSPHLEKLTVNMSSRGKLPVWSLSNPRNG